MKDLTGAERLFQLGEGDFPPLRTLDATNLPVVSMPLVGRERELEELVALLSNGKRLVTSRARAARARRASRFRQPRSSSGRFRDGVFWTSLAGLTDPELLPSELAQTIGAPDDLTGFLRGRKLLLLLDNFEHLLDAAPTVSDVLGACPEVRVLVTSRAPLRVAGEQEYRLDPLPREAGRRPLRRARSGSRARGRSRRDRRGDLPSPRRPSARHRAGGGAYEAARARAASRAARLGARRLDGRRPRRSRAAADAARDDRVELRPARPQRPRPLLAPLGVLGHVPAGGRRGGLRRRARRPRRARRLQPRQADRRGPLPHARDHRRVRPRAAQRAERGAGAARAPRRVLLAARRAGVPAALRSGGGVVGRLDSDHDDLRAALDWLAEAEPDRALELAARSAGSGSRVGWCARDAGASTRRSPRPA